MTPPSALRIALEPERLELRVRRVGLGGVAVLVLLEIFGDLGWPAGPSQLRELFDLAGESGLAAWWGFALAAAGAACAWGMRRLERSRASGGPATGWGLVAAILAWMSIDDGSHLHERVGGAIGSRLRDAGETSLGNRLLESVPTYTWLVVYGPLLLAVAGFLAWFLWKEIPSGRRSLVGAFGCWGVALGLDFLDGLPNGHPLDPWSRIAAPFHPETTAARWGETPLELVEHIARAAEEAIELVALTLVVSLLVGALVRGLAGVSFTTPASTRGTSG